MKKEAFQPREIQDMSEGIVQAQTVLDFRLLHDIIILFVAYIRGRNNHSKKDLVIKARKMALKLHGWTNGRITTNTDDFNRYLKGEIDKHQEFLVSAALCGTHARRSSQLGIARYLESETAELEAHVRRLQELRGTLPEAPDESQQQAQLI